MCMCVRLCVCLWRGANVFKSDSIWVCARGKSKVGNHGVFLNFLIWDLLVHIEESGVRCLKNCIKIIACSFHKSFQFSSA